MQPLVTQENTTEYRKRIHASVSERKSKQRLYRTSDRSQNTPENARPMMSVGKVRILSQLNYLQNQIFRPVFSSHNYSQGQQ